MKRPTSWRARAINAAAVVAGFPPLRIALVILLLCVCLWLSGCATQQLVEVKVPVPVECREPVPPRPTMPTEGLRPEAGLLDKVKALLAEIELREGYEVRLRAALDNCTAPIAPP
jgi:hypothetical protein